VNTTGISKYLNIVVNCTSVLQIVEKVISIDIAKKRQKDLRKPGSKEEMFTTIKIDK
jgi:hypothetical protein